MKGQTYYKNIMFNLFNPNYSCKFKPYGTNQLSRKFLTVEVQKQPLVKRIVRKTNIKHC